MHKVRHYLAAIDAQVALSHETDAFIKQLGKPLGRPL